MHQFTGSSEKIAKWLLFSEFLIFSKNADFFMPIIFNLISYWQRSTDIALDGFFNFNKLVFRLIFFVSRILIQYYYNLGSSFIAIDFQSFESLTTQANDFLCIFIKVSSNINDHEIWHCQAKHNQFLVKFISSLSLFIFFICQSKQTFSINKKETLAIFKAIKRITIFWQLEISSIDSSCTSSLTCCKITAK